MAAKRTQPLALTPPTRPQGPVGAFDQSMKYLLEHHPLAFLRFGLGPQVRILRVLGSSLPSMGREIDGGFLIEADGERAALQVEFHRRHQRREELSLDVAEAQVRLYRRERVPVCSLVFDLYGRRRSGPRCPTNALSTAHGWAVARAASAPRFTIVPPSAPAATSASTCAAFPTRPCSRRRPRPCGPWCR